MYLFSGFKMKQENEVDGGLILIFAMILTFSFSGIMLFFVAGIDKFIPILLTLVFICSLLWAFILNYD